MAVVFERGGDTTPLTVAEAASIAGVGRGTIRGWCSRGELPSVAGRRRGDRLIRRSDLERHLSRLRETDPGQPAGEPPGDAPTAVDEHQPLRLIREQLAGGDALRRIAAEVSGPLDLPTLFDDVIADSMTLFSVARVGLWLYDEARQRPVHARRPPRRAGRGHRLGRVARGRREHGGPRGDSSEERGRPARCGRRQDPCPPRRLRAERHRERLLRPDRLPRRAARPARPLPRRRSATGRPTSWTSPAASPTRWRRRSATPACTTRSARSRPACGRSRTSRVRLNRIRDLDEIATAIVEGTERLIGHDTIRVYRVDHDDDDVRADRLPGHVRRQHRLRASTSSGSPSARA